MDGFDLTRGEWIALAVVAAVVVVIPSWVKSIANRRRLPHQPPRHGYSVLAVMAAMLPLVASMVIFLVVSAFILGAFFDQIPENYRMGTVVLLCLVDFGVLLACLNFYMPKAYIEHLQNTPKGMHSPLDWLTGLVLSIVLFGGGFMQVGHVLSAGGG